ncbi:unnamed protein product, partial [Amoebophrya sp. A25]|eukprot:GSA25T00010930001.1
MRAFLLDLAGRPDVDAVEAKKQLLRQYVKETVDASNRVRGQKTTQEPPFQQALAESLSPARDGAADEDQDVPTLSEAARLVVPTEAARINDAFAEVMQEVDTEGPAGEQGLSATPGRNFGAPSLKKEAAASEALVIASLRAFSTSRANLLQPASDKSSGGGQKRGPFSFFRAYFRFLCRKVFSDKRQLGMYPEHSEGTSIDLAMTGAAITGWSGTEEGHEAFPYWVKKDRLSDATKAIYDKMSSMPSPHVRVINVGSPARPTPANTPTDPSDGLGASARLSPIDLLPSESEDAGANTSGDANSAPLHALIDAGALLWNFHEEDVATSFLQYFLKLRNAAAEDKEGPGRSAAFPAVAVAFHTFSGRLALKVGVVKNTGGARRVWAVRAEPTILRGSDHGDIRSAVVKDLKLHKMVGIPAEEWRRLLFCYFSTKRTTGVDFPLPKTKARALLTSGPRVSASRLRQAALRARQFLDEDGQQLQAVVTDEALKFWKKTRPEWTDAGLNLGFRHIISAARDVESAVATRSQLYALQLTMRGLGVDFVHRARAEFFGTLEGPKEQLQRDTDQSRVACLVAGQDIAVEKGSEAETNFGYESREETDDGTPQGRWTTMQKTAENLKTRLTGGVNKVAQACAYPFATQHAATTNARIESVFNYLRTRIEENEGSSNRATAVLSEDAGNSWLQGQKETIVEQEEDREEEQEMERESERELEFGFGAIRIYEPSPEDGKLEVRGKSSSVHFGSSPVGLPLIPLTQIPLPTRAQRLVREFEPAGSIGTDRAASFLDGFYLSRRFPVFFKPDDSTTGMPREPINHPQVAQSWSVRSLDLRLLRRVCVFFPILIGGSETRVSAPAFFFAETIQDCRLARDAMMDGRDPNKGALVVFERVLDFSPVIPAGGGQEFDFLQSATVHMPDGEENPAKQGGDLSLSVQQRSQMQMALCEMSIRSQLLLGDSQMLLRLLRYEQERHEFRRQQLDASSKRGSGSVAKVCGDTHSLPYTRTMLKVICNGETKGREATDTQGPSRAEVEKATFLPKGKEVAATEKVTNELQRLVDTYCPTRPQRRRLRLFLATTKND